MNAREAALREKVEAALAKPIAPTDEPISQDEFDPWDDLMKGIHGSYSSESDDLAITAMEAVRDEATFEFIKARGFVGEFMLYVLSGFGYLNYGTSPRGGWPDEAIADLWQPIIEKWTAYADAQWGEGEWRADP